MTPTLLMICLGRATLGPEIKYSPQQPENSTQKRWDQRCLPRFLEVKVAGEAPLLWSHCQHSLIFIHSSQNLLLPPVFQGASHTCIEPPELTLPSACNILSPNQCKLTSLPLHFDIRDEATCLYIGETKIKMNGREQNRDTNKCGDLGLGLE